MIEKNNNLIEEYCHTIISNLPQWNYSGAKSNPKVQEEIARFTQACSKIAPNLSHLEQLRALSAVVQEYVPDNHIFITVEGKNLRPAPRLPVTENAAFNNTPDLKIDSLLKFQVQPNKAAWIIGTVTETETGIIGIPSFSGNIEEQTAQRRKFIEAFFQQKEVQKWKNIIFDLRGNTGGDCETIKEIAERMSGQHLKSADINEMVPTSASRKKQSQGFSLNETHYNQLKPSDSFKGQLYILQDRYNASAAEEAVYLLKQLPHSKTVGTYTSGTYQGGALTELQMSQGSLHIGTLRRLRYDEQGKLIEEKKGMKPDISCKPEQALSKAQEQIRLKSITDCFYETKEQTIIDMNKLSAKQQQIVKKALQELPEKFVQPTLIKHSNGTQSAGYCIRCNPTELQTAIQKHISSAPNTNPPNLSKILRLHVQKPRSYKTINLTPPKPRPRIKFRGK